MCHVVCGQVKKTQPTCFPCVFHPGFVRRLIVEAVKLQLLVLLADPSMLVWNVYRRLVVAPAADTRGHPVLRPIGTCWKKTILQSSGLKGQGWNKLEVGRQALHLPGTFSYMSPLPRRQCTGNGLWLQALCSTRQEDLRKDRLLKIVGFVICNQTFANFIANQIKRADFEGLSELFIFFLSFLK